MNKIFSFLIALSLVFTGISYAKGFKMGGFKSYKSYKSYKSQSTLKHGNEPISKKYDTQKLKNKFNAKQPKSIKTTQKNYRNKPFFLSNPIFKWLIGGMIFGAILSMLMGYGFHFGMPGLLEILLIIGIGYLIYKAIKSSKREESYKLDGQR